MYLRVAHNRNFLHIRKSYRKRKFAIKKNVQYCSFVVFFSGLLFSTIFNILAAALQAMGDSKTSFHILLITGVLNILSDLLLIGILRFGVKGAAISTVLAQAISALLITIHIKKYDKTLLKPQFNKKTQTHIFRVGLPIALQSLIFPFANLIIQSSINSTGSNNIAAWALCGKLDFLVF